MTAGEAELDERQRYTSRLRQRAPAHVTAELGLAQGQADGDRQAAMLVQHALASTGARRATLFRPTPRGLRWHTVTVMADGGFYYGQIAPETLTLPMAVFLERRPVLLGPADPRDDSGRGTGEAAFRTYLGLPLMLGEREVGILEVDGVADSAQLAAQAATLGGALGAFGASLGDDAQAGANRPASGDLDETTVVALALRPPTARDETIAVAADEWPVLARIDGDRDLAGLAAATGLPPADLRPLVTALLARGLLQIVPGTAPA